MKVINYTDFIKNFNIISKKINNKKINYNELINLFKTYLINDAKNEDDLNYKITKLSLINSCKFLLKSSLNLPDIINMPYSYLLKDIPIRTSNENKFKILEEIGSGYYGTVYKIVENKNIYAIKEQKIDSLFNQQLFLNEVNKLKKLNNLRPQILPKFYDAWITNDYAYIKMEFINCGTLREYKINNKLTKNDYNQIEKLIKKIHKLGISHQDLHDDNILVNCLDNNKIQFLLGDMAYAKNQQNLHNKDYLLLHYHKYNNKLLRKNSKELETILKDTSNEDILLELIINIILTNNQLKLI